MSPSLAPNSLRSLSTQRSTPSQHSSTPLPNATASANAQHRNSAGLRPSTTGTATQRNSAGLRSGATTAHNHTGTTATHHTTRPARRWIAAATALLSLGAGIAAAPTAAAAPRPVQNGNGHIIAPGRTQISFTYSPTGFVAGTPNQHEARPGLSIVKLYIADYVFKHGTPADKARASEMIRTSNDAIASDLHRKYPNAISATARAYGLRNTHSNAHWGYARTSSYDSMKFVEAKKKRNYNDPVLVAMRQATPRAADGYAQDYGTAVLPGAIGTKWGWSDDRRSVHASVSYGKDFTVSANTYGTKQTHTNDVRGAFRGHMGAKPRPKRPAQRPLTPVQQAATRWADDMERAALNAPGSSVNARAIKDARRGLDPWIMRLP